MILFKIIKGDTNLDTEVYEIVNYIYDSFVKKFFKDQKPETKNVIEDFKNGIVEIARLVSLVINLTTNHNSKILKISSETGFRSDII